MADERAGADVREDYSPRRGYLWTELLRTFQIALDPRKLLLAAAGILLMATGWYLLSVIFNATWDRPKASEYNAARELDENSELERDQAAALAIEHYQRDLVRWGVLHRYAGTGFDPELEKKGLEADGGQFRILPWFEDRGPNPYLFIVKLLKGDREERRDTISSFFTHQVPVLVEPLIKFLSPVFGLLDPNASLLVRIYLILIILWTLAVWAFFGGMITRLAMVQLANKDQVTLRDTFRFVWSRYATYFASPLVPLIFIAFIVLCCVLFGLVALIPYVGDLLGGVGWFLILGAGIVMALLLIGLIAYPLMFTTLSAEGLDTFDAVSRSYLYLAREPLRYLWYGLVTLLYGVILVFFVVFVTSLMVYLGKWALSQNPLGSLRDSDHYPSYLFIKTPVSFGWRELMLRDTPVAIEPTTLGAEQPANVYNPGIPGYQYVNPAAAEAYMQEFTSADWIGAGLVSFWLGSVFLLMLGFAYSYFWTASSLIYLLMRYRVDEMELDEVYLEEETDEFKEPTAATQPPAESPPLVSPPTLRSAESSSPAESPTPAPSATGSDSPPGGSSSALEAGQGGIPTEPASGPRTSTELNPPPPPPNDNGASQPEDPEGEDSANKP